MTKLPTITFKALLDADVLQISLVTPEGMLPESQNISISVSAHDEVESEWLASLAINKVSDNTWHGQLPNYSGTGCTAKLLELQQIQIPRQDALPVTLSPGVDYMPALTLIEHNSDPVTPGADPVAELTRLMEIRNEQLNSPLQGESGGSNHFRAFVLADGCLFTRNLQVPGIALFPLRDSTRGSDIADIFNSSMRQLGSVTQLDPLQWAADFARQRPVLIAYLPNIRAMDRDEALQVARENVIRLLNVASLHRGAAPELLAGVVEREGSESWAPEGVWMEGGGYRGNLMGGAFSGERQRDLLENWSSASSDSRISLWLSLFADAIRETRWDFRFFRLFNLLESIALELYGEKAPIVDFLGNPILRPAKSGMVQCETGDAKGKVYLLCRNAAVACNSAESNHCARPSAGLWEEVQIWTHIRNAVAHEGGYRENDPVQNSKPRNQKVNSAFSDAAAARPPLPGRDHYLRAITESARLVVNSLLRRKL